MAGGADDYTIKTAAGFVDIVISAVSSSSMGVELGAEEYALP